MAEQPRRHEAHMKMLAEDEERLIDEFYANRRNDLEVQEIIDPTHYNAHSIQPIEYIMANKLPFAEGNVVKYITRWREKNGVNDLRKCRQYIDFLIKQEEEGKPL